MSRIKANVLRLGFSALMATLATPLLINSGEGFYGVYILVTTSFSFSIWLDDALRHYFVSYYGVHVKGDKSYRCVGEYFLKFLAFFAVVVLTVGFLIIDDMALRIMFIGINLANLFSIIFIPRFIRLLSNGDYYKYNLTTLITRIAVFVSAVSLTFNAFESQYLQFVLVYAFVIFIMNLGLSLGISFDWKNEPHQYTHFYLLSFLRKISIIFFSNLNLMGSLIVINAFVYETMGVTGNAIFGVAVAYASYIRMISGVLSFGYDKVSSKSEGSTAYNGILYVFLLITPVSLCFSFLSEQLLDLWLSGLGTIEVTTDLETVSKIAKILVVYALIVSFIDIIQKELSGKNKYHIYGAISFVGNVFLISTLLLLKNIYDFEMIDFAFSMLIISYLNLLAVVVISLNKENNFYKSLILPNLGVLICLIPMLNY